MNEFDRGLRQYVLGMTRVDGWKSDWRREFERRLKEEAARPRPPLPAPRREPPQIRVRQVRVQSRKRKPNREYFKRVCEVCGTRIRNDNKTGRCIHHKLERPQQLKEEHHCGACNKPIRKTEFGVCKPCFTRYRRRIQQNRPRCTECNTIIRSKTKYGLCRTHARPIHTRVSNALRKKAA